MQGQELFPPVNSDNKHPEMRNISAKRFVISLRGCMNTSCTDHLKSLSHGLELSDTSYKHIP